MNMYELIRKFFEYNDIEVIIVFAIFVIGCMVGGIYCIKGWKKEEEERYENNR